jgi:large subunit ribosomal protein L29
MPTTKTKDLRGMSDEQLGLTLKDTEKHLFQLRFQSATDRLETPSEIRKARRDIGADQLATRIAALDKKVAEDVPGKRTAFRQARRLKRFHAAKANKPAGAAASTKGSGK